MSHLTQAAVSVTDLMRQLGLSADEMKVVRRAAGKIMTTARECRREMYRDGVPPDRACHLEMCALAVALKVDTTTKESIGVAPA